MCRQPIPPRFRRKPGDPPETRDDCILCARGRLHSLAAHLPLMRAVSVAQVERDRAGLDGKCAADGRPGTGQDPLVVADGYRVHRSDVTDPASGLYDPARIRAEGWDINTATLRGGDDS
jgi:hypothetical protein